MIDWELPSESELDQIGAEDQFFEFTLAQISTTFVTMLEEYKQNPDAFSEVYYAELVSCFRFILLQLAESSINNNSN